MGSSDTARRYDVVFYAPWIGPALAPENSLPPGGAETQIFLLAREMTRQGLRVAVVAYETPEGLPSETGGIAVITLARPSGRGILRALSLVGALVRVMARLDATAFVQRAAGMETALVALIAKLKRRRFVFSSASDLDFDYERIEPPLHAVALYHLGIRLADAVVVQNRVQLELCVRRFGSEAHLIPSVAEPGGHTTQDPDAFLWVGRLASYKRPLAFVELARAVPEAQFRMVGVASGPGEMEAVRIADAAVELDNFELLSARPRGQLLDLVGRAVAMVSTSEYEGMPNVFLEGWARGVPALALAHNPDGVLDREEIGGFADGSSDRLAELARALWASRHDRADLSGRCRSYVEREHAPAAVVERWVSALALTPGRGGG